MNGKRLTTPSGKLIEPLGVGTWPTELKRIVERLARYENKDEGIDGLVARPSPDQPQEVKPHA